LPDIVDPQTRSRMMSGIRGKNTKPELMIRKGLHVCGFRFRLHARNIPGKPDLVLPRYRAAIMVHGCFWHVHDCHLFKMPSTRTEFWKAKLEGNRQRDARVREQQLEAGWRRLVIWECALKGKTRRDPGEVLDRASRWITSDSPEGLIEGMRA